MSDPADGDAAGGGPGPGEGAPGGARAGHLGYLAHEIRNPLSTALWTAELLARLPPDERGGARGQKLVTLCLRSLSRVRHLVEDHLLCERLDAGGYPLRPQALEVAELVEAALARGPAGDAPVERSVAAGLAVRGDRDLLARALDALVAAAAGAGPVRLSASPGGGRVAIRVGGSPGGSLEDPGRGTPADPRGRALALAAARRIAAAHGGTLEADPEGYLLTIPAA